MMSTYYYEGQPVPINLKNISVGKKIQLLGLSANSETPLIFEKTIQVENNQSIEIDFVAATQEV